MNDEVGRYRSQSGLKLHLGCGQVRLEGYVNIDKDPTAKADIFIDVMDLDKEFGNSSISEVQMYHILNYLTLWNARSFFVKLFRLLEPNGKICLETVNIEKTIEMIKSSNEFFPDYLEGVRSFHAFGNDHLEAQLPYYPNAFSWTPWHLKRELELAGFENIKVLPSETHHPFRDMRIEAQRLPNITIDKLSPGVGTKHKPRVLFLLDPELGHATVQVRGLMHKKLFHEQGWEVSFVSVRDLSESDIVSHAQQYEIVYLLKVSSLSLVKRLARETKCKIIFDLTDALWKPYHVRHGWQDLTEILKSVNCIFSENKYICEYGRRFNAVYSVPVVTHPERIAELKHSIGDERSSDKVRIGWIGSTGTVNGVLKIKDVLLKILQEHSNVELRIVGCKDTTLLSCFKGLNVSWREDYDEQQMLEELVGFDIGLYPVPVDEEDYALRGAQKAMLYMQAGAVAFALPIGDCADIIRDGENGFLIYSDSEWLSKLSRAILDENLRKKIGNIASEEIGRSHSHRHVFDILVRGFEMVLSGKLQRESL